MRKFALPAAAAVTAVIALVSGVALAALGGGGPAGILGTPYPVDLNVQSDSCGHDPFIFSQDPPPHNMTLQVVTQDGRVSIFGPSPWVEVHGTMDGDQFFATGMGTVAGFQNVTVVFQGTLTGQSLTGKYQMGAKGELPPCGQPPQSQPAVYGVKPKPTATPTGTPPKLYSIIVLKLNDDTNLPLSGWRMNLYTSSNCQGSPFDFEFTDGDGLAHFTGLSAGTYSVQEKMQAGWNPDGPVCQNVTVPGAAGDPAGLPPCPIQPDQDFPQPGCDTFLSSARVVIVINATSDT